MDFWPGNGSRRWPDSWTSSISISRASTSRGIGLTRGVDNGLILENAAWLSASGHPVVFRVPLIPGFNDGPEDLVALGHFLDSIDARAVEVLPYHPLGEGKIDRYGLDFPRLGLPAMPEAVAMEKAERLRGRGRDLSVAGREI